MEILVETPCLLIYRKIIEKRQRSLEPTFLPKADRTFAPSLDFSLILPFFSCRPGSSRSLQISGRVYRCSVDILYMSFAPSSSVGYDGRGSRELGVS